jgi:hypothetical protein
MPLHGHFHPPLADRHRCPVAGREKGPEPFLTSRPQSSNLDACQDQGERRKAG